MKPSPEDAEPAKIAHDGTPTIFSFLTTPAGPEAGLASTDERLEASFETFSLQPGGAGEGGTKHGKMIFVANKPCVRALSGMPVTNCARCIVDQTRTRLGLVLMQQDAVVAEKLTTECSS
jgi:hypothetical protein